ncbi:MAG: type IV secretory system conjugative DNA transfer family protein, partial [Geminicoccaceae bacterium]|nr:type IV secretory system conjugative DNA transfer family protein [Geminicoccaceae bacterium]
DYHICVMGMAGLGKTTSISAPNIMHLLTGGSADCPPESLIVLDWKNGELTRMAAAGTHELTGEPAIVYAPFADDNAVGINVFDDIIRLAERGEPIVDAARARLNSFYSEKIASAGQNSWIDRDALGLSLLVIAARAYLDPEAATLGGLWDFSQASLDDITGFMEVASEQSDLAGGFIAAGASGFLNRYGSDNQRELRWILQSMSETFSLFARGSRLRRATQTSTVDISALKKQPRAVFIQIPDRFIDTAASFVLGVLDYMIETLAHADGPVRVSIVAEEFSALPYSESILKWVRVYRSLGIRIITVVQDRSGFSRFKKQGGHQTFEQNSVKLYFGLSDADHLQHLERRAGKRSVLIPNRSTSLGLQVPGRSTGGTEMLTPVLPVSEIARIGAGKAILDMPGQPLFILERKPWWEQDDIAHRLRDTRPAAGP